MAKKDREAELLAEAEKQVAPFHATEPSPPAPSAEAPAPPTGTLVESLLCTGQYQTPWGILGNGWAVRIGGGTLTFINPKGVEREIKPRQGVPVGYARTLLASGKFKRP